MQTGKCRTCKGAGVKPVMRGTKIIKLSCPACNGTGKGYAKK